MPLLDVLRGVAILGTLMTNVWLFAAPGAEAGVLKGSAAMWTFDASWSGVAEGTFRFLADGKFLSMLTILFGVGLAIQFQSAAKRGRTWPGRYKWRALFLFVEGTVHFVFVFAWDVLMGYAVVALLVAWQLTRTARTQRVLMGAAAAVHVAVLALLTAAALGSASGQGSSGGGAGAEAVALYAEGSYPEQIAFRLHNAIGLRIEPVISFALLVFLFHLGVRLFRAGAFAPDANGRRIRRRMCVWGLGLGLPLNALTAAGGSDFYMLGRYGAAPVVAIGYMGLIGLIVDRVRRPGPLTAGLSAVGRTALSCYVFQNVLCMLACYGIGLGLAARWADHGPWWVMGLWAVVCVVLFTGARLWLRHFEHGPLETVQKRLLRA
ncbi:DUF418 domain-containing protein [Streptomyces albofaciens JCM 4342]|uniref:DUF418 domain-containing protein n=1 Tax=Streptomyces albofaciens TaxID=66866 RepID=UPI00123B0928|nr:DUF418 domain-containing protein [Streptomyces albofaciens JCM 4342]